MNTVFCKRLKDNRPALMEAPISGPLGEILLANVSKEAWDEWLELQIKIINEERLDLSEEAMQTRLCRHMLAFFGLSELMD